MSLSPTSNEEGIAGENDLVFPILHKPADAVLRVARRVQRSDLDTLANHKGLAVLWCLRDGLTVLATNDRQALELRKNLGVAASVVPVVMCVDDGGQIDCVTFGLLFENGGDLGRIGWVDDDRIFGLFIGDKVGVVVGGANP